MGRMSKSMLVVALGWLSGASYSAAQPRNNGEPLATRHPSKPVDPINGNKYTLLKSLSAKYIVAINETPNSES